MGAAFQGRQECRRAVSKEELSGVYSAGGGDKQKKKEASRRRVISVSGRTALKDSHPPGIQRPSGESRAAFFVASRRVQPASAEEIDQSPIARGYRAVAWWQGSRKKSRLRKSRLQFLAKMNIISKISARFRTFIPRFRWLPRSDSSQSIFIFLLWAFIGACLYLLGTTLWAWQGDPSRTEVNPSGLAGLDLPEFGEQLVDADAVLVTTVTTFPVDLDFDRDGTGYVLDKNGIIFRIKQDGARDTVPWLIVTSELTRVTSTFGRWPCTRVQGSRFTRIRSLLHHRTGEARHRPSGFSS